MPKKSMPFVSHRIAETRSFDCLYDTTYTVPSEKDIRNASQTALDKSTDVKICTKYDLMFADEPKSARLTFRKQKVDFASDIESLTSSTIVKGYVNYCTDLIARTEVPRLSAGTSAGVTQRKTKIITSPSQCDVKASCVERKPQIEPAVVHVKLSDSATVHPRPFHTRECNYEPKRPKKQTRGTQTLYRESSAQTLPYLPGVSNDKRFLETLELFHLPKILPGDGPPGLYEVEVLERARKRWAYFKALKEKQELQRKKLRNEAEKMKKIPGHKKILDAFEWIHWLEREEYIQDCQMRRFEIVLKLFDKREKEMRSASKTRIEKSCELIAAKREAALKKNEIEYGREIRRLQYKHERRPRTWRKEKISKLLGDPGSEFYAPQRRYGVDPSHRNFVPERKDYEPTMGELEMVERANAARPVCAHSKWREWAKPKERIMEVEQNFCKEANLSKLYESLKTLREQSRRQKKMPRCLIEKGSQVPSTTELLSDQRDSLDLDFDGVPLEEEFDNVALSEKRLSNVSRDVAEEEPTSSKAIAKHESLLELGIQRTRVQMSSNDLLEERWLEELQAVMSEYEGTAIGWLMLFLTEEMSRLEEQRKLHFIAMLAQKERWRREAAEAGLRQKENEMRKIYERLFDQADLANTEVCERYLDNILQVDLYDIADEAAVNAITETARIIDRDAERWLESVKSVQNPMNYDTLRCLLRQLVFPDWNVCCLAKKYESEMIVAYIIEDVLLPKVFGSLEPFDVVWGLTNEMIDRLIDTDLYYFSSEGGTECDTDSLCECDEGDLEAKAIIRKVIRYAVPGRRYRTSAERIADENVKDVVEDVCGQEKKKTRCHAQSPRERRKSVHPTSNHMDLILDLKRKSSARSKQTKRGDSNSVLSSDSYYSLTATSQPRITTYILDEILHKPDITRMLEPEEPLPPSDAEGSSDSELIQNTKYKFKRDSVISAPTALHMVQSTYDIMSIRGDISRMPSLADLTTSSEEVCDASNMAECLELNRITEEISVTHVIRCIIQEIADQATTCGELRSHRVKVEVSQSSSSSEEKELPVAEEDKFSAFEMEMEAEVENKLLFEDDLVINESELELMQSDRCKCAMELEREAYIRKMLRLGKVKIIPKKREESDSDNTFQSEVMSFEYNSSSSECHKTDYKSCKLYDADDDQPEDESESSKQDKIEMQPAKVVVKADTAVIAVEFDDCEIHKECLSETETLDDDQPAVEIYIIDHSETESMEIVTDLKPKEEMESIESAEVKSHPEDEVAEDAIGEEIERLSETAIPEDYNAEDALSATERQAAQTIDVDNVEDATSPIEKESEKQDDQILEVSPEDEGVVTAAPSTLETEPEKQDEPVVEALPEDEGVAADKESENHEDQVVEVAPPENAGIADAVNEIQNEPENQDAQIVEVAPPEDAGIADAANATETKPDEQNEQTVEKVNEEPQPAVSTEPEAVEQPEDLNPDEAPNDAEN